MAREPANSQLVPADYMAASKRPLQILAFLLPLIVLYEIGLAVVLRSESGVLTNEAHRTLLRFFSLFGVSDTGGLYLGGIVIVVVLLIWHLLERDRWTVSWKIVALMAVESVLLTAPLLLISQAANGLAAPATSVPAADWSQLGLVGRMAIAVGAGLYEELLFRMILIAAVHALIVDAAKAANWIGSTIAVVVSTVAFTWYHPLEGSTPRLVFYLGAGLYLGILFLFRGFGVVVAVHAFYDVIMLTLDAGDGG